MQGSPKENRPLAQRLRVLRAERQLTMKTVAERAGIRTASLSDIEHARTKPHDRTLAKLAAVYGVPVRELIEEPLESSLVGSPKAEAPAPVPEIETSDIEELRQMARDLKSEWSRLGGHDRVRALPREEHLETLRRQEEIEVTLRAVGERARVLREQLKRDEAEGVFELAAAG